MGAGNCQSESREVDVRDSCLEYIYSSKQVTSAVQVLLTKRESRCYKRRCRNGMNSFIIIDSIMYLGVSQFTTAYLINSCIDPVLDRPPEVNIDSLGSEYQFANFYDSALSAQADYHNLNLAIMFSRVEANFIRARIFRPYYFEDEMKLDYELGSVVELLFCLEGDKVVACQIIEIDLN